MEALDREWPGGRPPCVWVHRPGTAVGELSAASRIGVFVTATAPAGQGTVLRDPTEAARWRRRPADVLPPGAVAPLSWVEDGHLLACAGTIVEWVAEDAFVIAGVTPPTVVQRRAEFRVRAALRTQLVGYPSPAAGPGVLEAVTVDVSGGGCSLDVRWGPRPPARTPVAVVMWLPDGPVTAAGAAVGGDRRQLWVRFTQLHPRDESRLVGFVQRRATRGVH